jgi:DnaJ like chaperone protein
MSIWTRIGEFLTALATGESLADALARLRTPPEQTVAFTIAVIALGAKMAKADGTVTRDEVSAFREVFRIAPKDEPEAARVYNLARQDVAGFELWADRISAMFGEDRRVLEDLLEGLFHIASADGGLHPAEEHFLQEVAARFRLDPRVIRSLSARYGRDGEPDPYAVLGVARDDPVPAIRRRWRELVKECHPDRMVARGLPEETMALATKRLAAINSAWRQIEAERSHETA